MRSCTVLLAASFLFTCGCMKDNRVLEVSVAQDLKLGPEWKVIQSEPLVADRPWSEVLIQVPTYDVKKGPGDAVLLDGVPVAFEGWLQASDGEKVILDKVGWQAWGARTFITLRGSSLEGKGQKRVFDKVGLRVDRAIAAVRVLWMSYDPQDFKAGVAEPSDPGSQRKVGS
jgi:hypothetical protein